MRRYVPVSKSCFILARLPPSCNTKAVSQRIKAEEKVRLTAGIITIKERLEIINNQKN
jgi:hypothetical protein